MLIYGMQDVYKRQHIYQISEALQKNEFVCIHADRFIEGNRTVKMDFLGKAADFPVGPFVLAARLQVPVSFVFALKESKLHYHFYASQPKVYSSGERNKQHESMMTEMCIRDSRYAGHSVYSNVHRGRKSDLVVSDVSPQHS